MHDSIRDLGRGRSLNDFLEETAAIADEGTQIGRARRFATAAELHALAEGMGAVEVIDGTRGPRVVEPRETPVRRLTLRAVETAVDVDDHVSSVEEMIARQDARFGGVDGDPDQVAGSTYADLEECAAGKRRVPGTTGGGDRSRKKSRRGGAGSMAGPTKVSAEHWDHERSVGGRPRKGKDPRDRFSVRAEPVTRATIATTGKNESDFLAEAAKLVAMAQTGAQADELMRAVIALAGSTKAAA